MELWRAKSFCEDLCPGILEIDEGSRAAIGALDHDGANLFAKIRSILFRRDSLADVFERRRHVGNRVLIKFGQHYRFGFGNAASNLPCSEDATKAPVLTRLNQECQAAGQRPRPVALTGFGGPHVVQTVSRCGGFAACSADALSRSRWLTL